MATPKQDWVSSDTVAAADFNRIEENTTRFSLCANHAGATLSSVTDQLLGGFRYTLEDDFQLILVSLSAQLNGMDAIRVDVSFPGGSTSYTTTTNRTYDLVNQLMRTNTTGADSPNVIEIRAISTIPDSLVAGDAGWAEFLVRAV